jgi:predicted dehydrogenase
MVRYGIAGFGLHAVKRMIPGFRQAQRSQLVALSRREMDKAQQSAREFEVPLAFNSVEDLCRHPEVDAIFIATPNVCHLSDVMAAARNGKHILCEKPMAMNADESRRMIEAANHAGVKLGVAQVFRFENSVCHIRDRVGSGELGRIVLARSEFFYPGLGSLRKWINDRNTGGGTVADVGVHCIDALRFVLQDEVVRVQAQTVTETDSGDVDASGALVLEFGRGTLATVMVSMRAEYRTAMEIVGTSGVLSAENAFTVDSPLHVDLRLGGNMAETQEFTNFDSYARMLDAFTDWVGGREAFVAPGEEGLRNQLILDAAYESARTGRAIELSIAPPRAQAPA